MIELGKKQKLLVVKTVEFGIYLAENKEADAKNRVLLPANRFPRELKKGTGWKYLFIRIPRTA